ncbi:MAG: hypothetical protein ACUVWV_13255 [Thermodesulfobacteriota bacterium]
MRGGIINKVMQRKKLGREPKNKYGAAKFEQIVYFISQNEKKMRQLQLLKISS